MTEEQKLKEALAKLLPETIRVSAIRDVYSWTGGIYNGEFIRDTEWLHVCWLIEKTFKPLELIQYAELLANETEVVDWGYYPGEASIDWDAIATISTSSWQQRAQAICKVKGIEIV